MKTPATSENPKPQPLAAVGCPLHPSTQVSRVNQACTRVHARLPLSVLSIYFIWAICNCVCHRRRLYVCATGQRRRCPTWASRQATGNCTLLPLTCPPPLVLPSLGTCNPLDTHEPLAGSLRLAPGVYLCILPYRILSCAIPYLPPCCGCC